MTEEINPQPSDQPPEIDILKTDKLLALMHKDATEAHIAVGNAIKDIERAVDDAVDAIGSGGGVVYAGAGTSGRLAVLDASEIPPTFGSNAFRAIIAGGEKAVTRAVEGAEDNREAGVREGESLSSRDMAVGVTASGSTPFVLGFLEGAKNQGARCWLIACSTPDTGLNITLDGLVILKTGPELIEGSTRMKAGTAQKIALNMISTATMIRLGGCYDRLMVNVTPTNIKLRKRAEGIVIKITGCDKAEAAQALEEAGMNAKLAALMLKGGRSKDESSRLLKQCGGQLRKALASLD